MIVSGVMIVDDDMTTVKLLQTLLQMDGFVVTVASKGLEAVELAQQNQPEVFLIDYHLADMEGIELLRQLREGEFSQTPIVMTSGLDVREEVLKEGANEFLVKPFEPDDLPDLFRRLMG